MNHIVAALGDFIFATTGTTSPGFDGNTVRNTLRDFIAPFLLLGISIFALTFLLRRQLTQFFQFVAIAVLVAVLFYTPNVIENIAKWLGNIFGGTA